MELLKYLRERADVFEGLNEEHEVYAFIGATEDTIVKSLHMYRTTLDDRGKFERPNDWTDAADFFELNLDMGSFERIMREMHEVEGIFYYYLSKMGMV